MKKVIIIGGGLAGLSLGIALRRRGVPVSLFEAGSYPRHRVCGEFICGIREETLEELGIDALFHDAHRHRSVAFFRDGKTLLRAEMPRPAYGLSRFALDHRLALELEKLGGELYAGSKHDLDAPGAEGTVYAAGRHVERSPWLGLKMHFTGLEPDADLELHLGRGGYAGLSAVEDGRYNVCGLFRRQAGVRARKHELLCAYLRRAGLEVLARRLESASPCPESALGISSVKFHKSWERRDRCHLGDHFAVIPPFTGNGMSLAMESSLLATPHLEGWAAGRSTWEAAQERMLKTNRKHFGTRLRSARLLHPWIYTRPGQSLLALSVRSGLLPFNRLFQLTH